MWLRGQLEDGAEDVCQLNSTAPPMPSGPGLFLSLTPRKNFETLSFSVLVMFRGTVKAIFLKTDIETILKRHSVRQKGPDQFYRPGMVPFLS